MGELAQACYSARMRSRADAVLPISPPHPLLPAACSTGTPGVLHGNS